MNDLLIGLVGAVLATNQPAAVSNLVQEHTGIAINIATNTGPAEMELQKIMAGDDDARAEIDKWIQDNDVFRKQGAGESDQELNKRIMARLNVVRTNYINFIKRYTNNAHGYLAYGSFLNDIGEEAAAGEQYEKSRDIDPKNPAVWNNLGNYYGEYSPVTNAFVCYARAIQLDPTEPIYYENFATTVYLFRKDAREFYNINEQQVFDKALELYREAMKLLPDDFKLATDYAQNYYGIKPLRTNDALMAWTNALNIAHNEIEREAVYVHLARMNMLFGRYAEARSQLNAVTNTSLAPLKDRVSRAIKLREDSATNAPPAEVSTNLESANEHGTNILAGATNSIPPTNTMSVFTNRPHILTNALPVTSDTVKVMTNVSPISPKPRPMDNRL